MLFRGEARRTLGSLCEAAERARNPQATAEALAKVRDNPLRAPVVVACVASIVADHPKVPPVEQVASTAAAVQNMQLAAEALGFGAMWRTGPLARDAGLKVALGFAATDEIVGFLYLGTPQGERRAPVPLAVEGFVREWPAP